MLGDAHDLAAATAWVDQDFWGGNTDEETGELKEWPFNEETRINVAELVKELGEAFSLRSWLTVGPIP